MSRTLRLGAVLIFAVALSGCANNSEPKNYNADVKANYDQACQEANAQKPGLVDPVAFCECTYKGFVETIKFDKFKQYDNDVRDKKIEKKSEIEATYPEVARLIDSCNAAGPTAGSATTTITVAR